MCDICQRQWKLDIFGFRVYAATLHIVYEHFFFSDDYSDIVITEDIRPDHPTFH